MSRNKKVRKLEDENKKLRSAFTTQLSDGQAYRDQTKTYISKLEAEVEDLKQQLRSPRETPLNIPKDPSPRDPKENQPQPPEKNENKPKLKIPNINMKNL